jgi:hypothetical protein
MTRNRLVAICTLCAALAIGHTRLAAAADGAQFSLSVKQSHMLGSSSGTLRITPTGIEYDTADKADARRWNYVDVQQLQIPSPKRVLVLTYEDQGRLRFGADRRFDFELRDGSISPEIIAFLLAHTARPVVTAVLPPLSKTPLFRLLVKHERHGRGSDGVLLMYDDALVYGTERASDTRYWRFRDIFAVLPLDRDRLQVLAYEGGGGELRPFTFQLKSELPEAFARALWAQVNPPAPFAAPTEPAARLSGLPPGGRQRP